MTSRTAAEVQIIVDGRRPAGRLVAVRVASRLSLPTQCALTFQLGHGAHGWPDEWPFGAALSVRVTGDAEELFTGEVTAVQLRHRADGDAELKIRGYDLLHRLRKRQQLRVLREVTAADVAATVTGDLDLKVEAADPGPRFDRIMQHRQSDFELLVQVAGEAGLYPVLHDRTVHLLTLAGFGEPVELRRGDSLWDLRVEANLDRVARRVTAIGWHNQRAEVHQRPAASPRRPETPLQPDPRQIGVDGDRMLVDRSIRGAAQLAAAAQADLDASTSRAVTAEGVADGDARLRAGVRITVAGLPTPPAGEYVLGSVVHTVDAAGYQSTFSTALPEPPAPAAVGIGAGITLGHVSDVSDPERLARVQVMLPAYGGLDAGWLPVLHPGAGADRGLMILPEVGDTVVVALPGHSPAGGLVLGSLYGKESPPDDGVVDGAVRRWSMRTSAGASVVVDDAERLVRIENPDGSFVELGRHRARLHATTDLVIEAPGKAITVRAQSVDFEHAG